MATLDASLRTTTTCRVYYPAVDGQRIPGQGTQSFAYTNGEVDAAGTLTFTPMPTNCTPRQLTILGNPDVCISRDNRMDLNTDGKVPTDFESVADLVTRLGTNVRTAVSGRELVVLSLP